MRETFTNLLERVLYQLIGEMNNNCNNLRH